MLDYWETDLTFGEWWFDVVLDFVGGLLIWQWKRVIKLGGVLVLGGVENGGRLFGLLLWLLGGIVMRGLKVVMLMADVWVEDFAALAEAFVSSELCLMYLVSYLFAEAVQVVDVLCAVMYLGKIVLMAE